MKIDVSFNSERNETVIAALKNSHGDRCIIDRLCDEYGTVTVLNALYHMTNSEDCPAEFTCFDWKYTIQDWLYQYFYEDCMNYVFDAVFAKDLC